MQQPRIPTVKNAAPSTAVSDQARSTPDYKPPVRVPTPGEPTPEAGEPFHSSKGWGAKGTDGTGVPAIPARPANVASAIEQAAANVIDLTPAPVSAPVQVRQPIAPPAAPAIVEPPQRPVIRQPLNTTQSMQQPQSAQLPEQTPVQAGYPSVLNPVDPNANRMTALENQVANLGTLLATLSNQLQSNATLNPALNVTAPEPFAPSTANPLAPVPHNANTQQRALPRIEGDAIPKPDPQKAHMEDRPRLPNQAIIPELSAEEQELSQAEYIERHFRRRDFSIYQIAYMCNMSEKEVTDVLIELGYQLPKDLRN